VAACLGVVTLNRVFKSENRVSVDVLCSSLPHSSNAVRALKSSLNARKIFVRDVYNSVRQDSPGKVERRELMGCVATIGMHLACRDSAKNFSSPVGSLSPTVAKL